MSRTQPADEQQVDDLDVLHLIGFARSKAAEARRGQQWSGTAYLLERLATELYQSRMQVLRAEETARQAELAVERTRERRARQRRLAADRSRA